MTNENELRSRSAERMQLDRMRQQAAEQAEVGRLVRGFAMEQAGEICQRWGISNLGNLFNWAARIESFVRFGAGAFEADDKTRRQRQFAVQQALKLYLHCSVSIDEILNYASEIDAFIEHAACPSRLPAAPVAT